MEGVILRFGDCSSLQVEHAFVTQDRRESIGLQGTFGIGCSY